MVTRRILIVDDDPQFRELLASLAVRGGFDCHGVDGGESASERLAQLSFDLAIVDASCDGCVETLRNVARMGQRAPVLLLGGGSGALLNACMKTGQRLGLPMLHPMAKPLDVDEFQHVLQSLRHEVPAPSVEEMERALERGEFVLNYQPKVELSTSRVCGLEALLRWDHPRRGRIFPGDFIAIAERSRVARPLTLYVLRHALSDCADWRAAGFTASVAVNVPVSALEEMSFPPQVESLLRETNVPPEALTMEVTETVHRKDAGSLLDVLARLRMHGVRISIDDFGTGHSSLTELHEMPVNEVKIDRSFVLEALSDRDARAIVDGIIGLGHSFGLDVIAEGVETEAHWNLLKGMGCDQAQGFYLEKAMSLANAKNWMRRWNQAMVVGSDG